jgi:hypothetical protein
VIELTDEIRAAFRDQGIGCDEVGCADCLNNRLVAVLDIVERNLRRPAPVPNRCADCGRTGRNLVAVPDGDSTVLLGPTCRRRRLDAGQVRQALPIGGER